MERRKRRQALVAATVAVGGLAVASSGATGSQSAGENSKNSKPVARLAPKHARVRVGEKVLFDSSRSRDRDGRIVYHLWDLDGDGVFERSSGHHARIRHAFRKAGTVRVGVAVIDDDGGYSVRRARVKAVVAKPESSPAAPTPTSENIGAPRSPVREATRSTGRAHVRSAKASSTTAPSPTVTAASSTTVVIKDFAFKPTPVTVNVGDTVTWRNDDSTVHTATADDGSFDTGSLSQGQTGQFRFTKAGTFKYHCIPHASSMKATVIVKASDGSTTSNTGGTSPSSSDSSGGSSGNSGSGNSNLPHTGLEIAAVLIAGLALLGAGTALRRRLGAS